MVLVDQNVVGHKEPNQVLFRQRALDPIVDRVPDQLNGNRACQSEAPHSHSITSVRNWPTHLPLWQIRIIQGLTLSNRGSNSVSMLDQVKGDGELSLDETPQFTDEESEAAVEAKKVGRGSLLSYSLGSTATLISTDIPQRHLH